MYIKILGVIGIFLGSYLLYEFITRPAIQPCYINSTVNCDAVTVGPISTLFGVPVALYGITGYIFILIGAFLSKPKLILGMATFGMLFCLRLTIIEIFQLKVICPVCMTCQIDMLITFILALILNFKSTPNAQKPAELQN